MMSADGMLRPRKKQSVKPELARKPSVEKNKVLGADMKTSPIPNQRPFSRPHFGSLAIDARIKKIRIEGAELAKNILVPPPFPVDFVFTYVQDTTRLRKERLEYMSSLKQNVTDNDANRYEAHNELQYALRGVSMYLPWIRQVFLVIGDHEDQLPKFLAQTKPVRKDVYALTANMELKIVRHRDIFTGQFAAHLPTYNSHAIEAHLHRIPGLSEAFIASNDDFFVAEPLPYTSFFQTDAFGNARDDDGSSVSVVTMNNFTSGLLPRERAPGMHKHGIAWVNNIATLQRMFPMAMKGAQLRYQSHAPVPMFKTSFEDVWKSPVTHSLLMRTSSAKVRSMTDLYILGFIMYFHLFNRRGLVARLNTSYIELLVGMDFKKMSKRIAKNRPVIFCFNDRFSGKGQDSRRVGFLINRFLKIYFPVTLLCETQPKKVK